MKSWRTTTAGVLGVLGLILPAVAAAIDGNPQTDPNWAVVIPSAISALGLVFARDARVSSEAQGIK